MGLFSKILGSAGVTDDAVNSLKKAAKGLTDKLNEFVDEHPDAVRQVKEERAAAAARQPDAGPSVYDSVPDEPNQYNYPGTYRQYFEQIFSEDFPAYSVAKEEKDGGRATLYTFRKDGAPALIVELKTEKSEANRYRREAQKAGIPYLRFYYDHDGWWNTRSYVTQRISGILSGC